MSPVDAATLAVTWAIVKALLGAVLGLGLAILIIVGWVAADERLQAQDMRHGNPKWRYDMDHIGWRRGTWRGLTGVVLALALIVSSARVYVEIDRKDNPAKYAVPAERVR